MMGYVLMAVGAVMAIVGLYGLCRLDFRYPFTVEKRLHSAAFWIMLASPYVFAAGAALSQ